MKPKGKVVVRCRHDRRVGGLLLPDGRPLAGNRYGAPHAGRFPLVMFVGYGFASAFASASSAVLSRFDQLGVASLTLATATLTVWMIPAALDATLADPSTAMAKYATLVATGFALNGVNRRAPLAMQSFFVLGLVWMTVTVGLIYQESRSSLPYT